MLQNSVENRGDYSGIGDNVQPLVTGNGYYFGDAGRKQAANE
jgi:hypothetical protein